MKVLKFGGSVLKNIDDIFNIKNIITNEYNEYNDKIILVFSAFYGITNQLIDIGNICAKGEDYNKQFDELKKIHIEIARELDLKKEEIDSINNLFIKIDNVLKIIRDKEKFQCENKDYLLAFGERLSNYIISSFFSKFFDIKQISPCEIINTDSNFGYARVNFEESNKKINKCILNIKSKIICCAGFFAADLEQRITTLGRNGSDYTASIIASAIKADKLEIWKDIDGLYTADPKIVKNVKIINQITYQEMAELSLLGNKIIHIDTIYPCILNNIPIVLRNCYNYSCKGTLISNEKCINYLINGIVKFDGIYIITIQVNENINITDIAIKLQLFIKNYDDIVITMHQNIKQRKISLMVSEARKDYFNENIESLFLDLLDKKYITIDFSKKMSLITVVGADLSNVVGLSGKMFKILEENNINVFSIQDDFSKTRLSFLCNVNDANLAVNLLHNKFLY